MADPPRRSSTSRRNLELAPGVVIIGARWGDKGKGKITELLAERATMIVRFEGGGNAGHTIVRDGETFAFHDDRRYGSISRVA
jgi:hypothetical protein